MAETKPIVFVVDDDESVRRSSERLLRAAGLEVKTFASAQAFRQTPRGAGPSCLVLDISLPEVSGIDLQQDLRRAGIRIPIIFVTGHGSIPLSVQAMKAGAVEFLTKPVSGRALLEAVLAALERDRGVLREQTELEELHRRWEQLTPRERQVAVLIAAGRLNKQAAGELATTERTIKFHRAHIMQKLRAESLADLVRMVEKLGVSLPR